MLTRREAITAAAAGLFARPAMASELNLVPVTRHSAKDDGSLYQDILSHSDRPITNEERYTNAHETCHMISAAVRNEYVGRNNGFYMFGGKAAVVDQPPIKIADIANYVPKSLHGNRYKLYLVDQRQHWNDEPLYILEEWHCYTMGGLVALDDLHNNRRLYPVDAVSGCFEFKIYGAALGMCVRERCPDYWRANEQFRNMLRWEIQTAEETFAQGWKVPEWHSISQDRLYTRYMSSDDGKRIQHFCDSVLLGAA